VIVQKCIEVVPDDDGYIWRINTHKGSGPHITNERVYSTRKLAVAAAKKQMDAFASMLGIAVAYSTYRAGGSTFIEATIALAVH
jgi:hypothetical protein